MGEPVFDSDVEFLSQPFMAGAVLCRTEQGNLHVGLIYRDKDQVAILHLGWQDTLLREWQWPRLWATPNVEPERLFSVAALCRRIWRNFNQSRKFPYALHYTGASFTPDGQLALEPNSQGLTCATFVLAVFSRFGVRLVAHDQWIPRPELDTEFLDAISDAGFATAQHLQLMRAEVAAGCIRVHPDEVIGACSLELPAGFAETCAAATSTRALLDGDPENET